MRCLINHLFSNCKRVYTSVCVVWAAVVPRQKHPVEELTRSRLDESLVTDWAATDCSEYGLSCKDDPGATKPYTVYVLPSFLCVLCVHSSPVCVLRFLDSIPAWICLFILVWPFFFFFQFRSVPFFFEFHTVPRLFLCVSVSDSAES